MIRVQRRSRAESTRDAMSDSEEDAKAATTLATRRRIFATTLIYAGVSNLLTEILEISKNRKIGLTLIDHLALLSSVLRFSLSSSGSKGSISPPVLFNAPPSSATPSPST